MDLAVNGTGNKRNNCAETVPSILKDLRGRVRREQRPVPKEILAGLVELVEGYESAPPERRAIMAKHISNGLALLKHYGEVR